MNKICVYTCITGNYDNLIELEQKEESIYYICFTNNKNLKSNTWDVRYINEDLDNLTLARKVKILGYQYLPDYDISVWIDGAINIEQPITKFLNECCDFNEYDMIAFNHKYRDCIFDEINECVRMNKETVDNANKLALFLEANNYPKHNGLIESTVIVRKNNSSVNNLMDDWFNMLSTYSRRDQLSFNYCLWKNPIRIKFLDMYVFDNEYFKHQGHNEIKRTNKYRIIFGDSNDFYFKYVTDSYFTIIDNMVSINQVCKRDTNIIVLELYDEIGSTISDITINGKLDYKLYNVYDLGDKVYFHDKPIIVFEGDFKKNCEINVSFRLLRNTEADLVKTILEKNNIILEMMDKESENLNEIQSLKDNYQKIKSEYEMLVNSRGWKAISKLRNMKNKIYRKK